MEIYSREVEENVLGNIIGFKECNIYIKQLEKSDFYIGINQIIFEIIKELYNQGKPVEVLSIKEAAKSKSQNEIQILEHIVRMTEVAFTSTTIEYYMRKLKNYSVRRKLAEKAQKILKIVQESFGDEDTAEIKKQAMAEIAEIKTSQVNLEEKEMRYIMLNTGTELERRYHEKDNNKYDTGFYDFDKVTDGLHEQELTVIAARPGVGKTSFALNIAKNIAKKGIYTYFVSLEMSEVQLGTRMIASETRIDGHRLRKGWLEEADWGKVANASAELAELKMIIDTQSTTVQDIETKAYELRENKNMGLIIIDYLQLLKSKEKFNIREQEVADISRRLKLLSRDLNIPIVALCQLNRETEKRGRPILADLRESGAIEQDADNVIFLYVSEEEKVKQFLMDVEVIVAKQRNGPTGTVFLGYNKKTMTFQNRA